jgi:putative ABC transport system permease protein
VRPGALGRRSAEAVLDVFAEIWFAFARRPLRSALTALGTLLGVGTLVATLGFSSTARSQVAAEFDALKATQVGLEAQPGLEDRGPVFPADTERRLDRLNGVVASGIKWSSAAGQDVSRVTPSALAAARGVDAPVVSVSAGYLAAAESTVRSGVLVDRFAVRRAEPVAVLGPSVASSLGIASAAGAPVVFVRGRPLAVVGILDDVRRDPSLLAAVVVPSSTAEALWGSAGSNPAALLHVRLGAADVVGDQAAVAVRPDHPEWLRAVVPPDPKRLRARVESKVNGTLLLLSAVSLLVGAVGITNSTLVSVMERVPEIGLRRALGASRTSILGQFLLEAAAIGGLGGLVGTSLAVLAVVLGSALQSWTPVLDNGIVLGAPLLGAAVGLLGGVHPALRASRVSPVEALRR